MVTQQEASESRHFLVHVKVEQVNKRPTPIMGGGGETKRDISEVLNVVIRAADQAEAAIKAHALLDVAFPPALIHRADAE